MLRASHTEDACSDGLFVGGAQVPEVEPSMHRGPGRALPRKRSVIGVPISIVDYDSAELCIMEAVQRREPLLVTALAVHGVVEARSRKDVGQAIAAFDLVTPDGHPVRMALNLLHAAGLPDRVYGPTLMLRLCRRAADQGVPIYLYGSTARVVSTLAAALASTVPQLKIAGAEPSLFRPLTDAESAALGERMRASGAGIVFIGLGCPRQELFAFEHRDIVALPQICVGAAFDFHSGNKRQAPRWMQDHALEWLFRLLQEPRRLFARYAVTNTVFLFELARQWAGQRS